jgi:hypothetical protein
MDASDPLNALPLSASTAAAEMDPLAEKFADQMLEGLKTKQQRFDSAETIVATEEYSLLPQLPQSEDHIAVVKRLLYEIRDLQSQVAMMSGWFLAR